MATEETELNRAIRLQLQQVVREFVNVDKILALLNPEPSHGSRENTVRIVMRPNYEPRRPISTARQRPYGTWLNDG